MKITSWNVNGLRAALNKGLLDWVAAYQPDVLCLQEIKARPDQLAQDQRNFPGYETIWNPAERSGYSGVATALRSPALEVQIGLEAPRFDVEGRTIQTQHPDFRLFNIYFPNGGRGQDRVEYKLNFYARLLELCDRIHEKGESIIITGDFNTAHRPIDLRHPRKNEKISGFLPEEREWVQKYLDHGFVDVYRNFYPERVQYTWWTYRMDARRRGVGWRIDYFLISRGLVERVQEANILEDIPGSDHCPIELVLD